MEDLEARLTRMLKEDASGLYAEWLRRFEAMLPADSSATPTAQRALRLFRMLLGASQAGATPDSWTPRPIAPAAPPPPARRQDHPRPTPEPTDDDAVPPTATGRQVADRSAPSPPAAPSPADPPTSPTPQADRPPADSPPADSPPADSARPEPSPPDSAPDDSGPADAAPSEPSRPGSAPSGAPHIAPPD